MRQIFRCSTNIFCSYFDLYEKCQPRGIRSRIEIDFYFRIAHGRRTVARNRRFGWFGPGSPVWQFFVSTDATSADELGWKTRFSGKFKGRRKPIKRFISCPHPPKPYLFCCFLINEKPVKKFSLGTTTATSIHFPRIPHLIPIHLHHLIITSFSSSSMDESVIWLLSLHHLCKLLYLYDHSLLYCAATPCEWRPISQKYFFVYKFYNNCIQPKGAPIKKRRVVKRDRNGEREREREREERVRKSEGLTVEKNPFYSKVLLIIPPQFLSVSVMWL